MYHLNKYNIAACIVVRLEDTNGDLSSGVLQLIYKDSWYYVCDDNWSTGWSDQVCDALGHGYGSWYNITL